MVKKILLPLTALTLFLSLSTLAHAADCTSQDHADWNSPTTWSCGAIPTTGDNVIIAHDVSFTLDIAQINNLTINNGASLTQNNTNTQTIDGTLTINGTLTHGDNSTANSYNVNFSADTIDIDTAGSINVDYLGYDGGNQSTDGEGYSGGAGTYLSMYGGGGANGGDGGDRVDVGENGGTAYCDLTSPAEPGSGGAGGSYASDIGGAGGGVVILDASTITVDGTITADGRWSNLGSGRAGGGAGGTISLTAPTINGSIASFTAVGGAASNNYGGGGGGGCVRLDYTTSTIDPETQIDVYGGDGNEDGGAGVILDIDNDGATTLYALNAGTSPSAESNQGASNLTADELILNGNAVYTTDSSDSLTLDNNSPFVNGDGTGTLRVTGGTLTTPDTLTIQNADLELHQAATFTSSTSKDITLANGTTLSLGNYSISTALEINSLLVQDGATVTHLDNSTSQDHIVNIDAATTITIASLGQVNVDALGYDGGARYTNGYGPVGAVGTYLSNYGGGGANGGDGGDRVDVGANGGTSFCEIENPTSIGPGGAGGSYSSDNGGSGGGAVILDAATVTINGTITADGTRGNLNGGRAGGGAGGSVKIVAITLNGTPTSFTATGGNAEDQEGGSGGGGCILLDYTSSTIDPETQIAMHGGSDGDEDGGAGLVLTKDGGTNDTLYVINNNNSPAADTNHASTTPLTVDSMMIQKGAVYVVDTNDSLRLTNRDPLIGGDGTGTLQVLDGTFNPSSDFTIENTTLEIHDDAEFLASNTKNVTIENSGILNMGYYTTTRPLNLASLTIESGGVATHLANSTTQEHVLAISADDITVNTGGSINVDHKGYAGVPGYTDGNGPPGGFGIHYAISNYGGGGAHYGDGGNARNTTDTGGTGYCNLNDPQTVGASGAGGTSWSGAGGGLIFLDVTGTLDINGEISADGSRATSIAGKAGGGGGGAVKFTADIITGTPSSFTASGGDARSVYGGGGGGGCILLEHTDQNNSITSGDVDVSGGAAGNEAGGNGGFETSLILDRSSGGSIVPEFRVVIYGLTIFLAGIALFIVMPKIKSQISP